MNGFRDDLNAARLDNPSGPRNFEIISVTDLAGRFAGSRTFIAGLEQALSEFHENVARHIRPWRARISDVAEPVDARAMAGEELTEQLNDTGQVANERKVKRSGVFDGKSFSIFDDGSIEIETDTGLKRFSDFAALQTAAAARNGHARVK